MSTTNIWSPRITEMGSNTSHPKCEKREEQGRRRSSLLDPWNSKQPKPDFPITVRPTTAQISDVVDEDGPVTATATSVPFYEKLNPYDGNFQIHTQLGRYLYESSSTFSFNIYLASPCWSFISWYAYSLHLSFYVEQLCCLSDLKLYALTCWFSIYSLRLFFEFYCLFNSQFFCS